MDFGRLKHGTVEVYLNGTLINPDTDYTIEGEDGLDTAYELHIKNPVWEKYIAVFDNPEKEIEVQIRYLPIEYHRHTVSMYDSGTDGYPYIAGGIDMFDMPTIDGITRIYPNALRTTVNWELSGEAIFKRATSEKDTSIDYIDDYQITDKILFDVYEKRILARYGKFVTDYDGSSHNVTMKNLKVGSSLDAVVPPWCVNELL